ncbi:uncharacterized protein KD926_010820 [Aspergillus affinis]|uniref:uncharacterized protein n=1 Tax=Aspergillus affinis TaxID=1070780 RepID=UPI0022FE60FB|nr:uncharacterized protein KD926_010820 [Aspergillus affinis]KAI9038403.1 hypothetical protein KD926_010820 [Aspergillus affinis]
MEAIGAASAIFEIATTGVQCSIKLLTFASQDNSAEEEITHIAEEVSLNASILLQLGDFVKDGKRNNQSTVKDDNGDHDENLSLVANSHDPKHNRPRNGIFNPVGLTTVLKHAEQCRGVFDTLNEGIKRVSTRSNSTSRTPAQHQHARLAMVKWPFLKPETEALRGQLREVKGTLVLMLQLAMLRYSRRAAEGGPRSQFNTFPHLSKTDEKLLVLSIAAAYQKKPEAFRPSSEGAKVNNVPDSVAHLNNLPQADKTKAADDYPEDTKLNCLSRFCKRFLPSKTIVVAADQASENHISEHDSIKETSLDSNYAIERSDVRPVDLEQQSFASASEARSCADDQDDTTVFVEEAKANVQYLSPPIESPLQSKSQHRAELLPLKEYLEVRAFSPVACIKDRKIHIEYVNRVIQISQESAQWQLQAWKSTSTDTVLSRLLALTTSENEALQASPCTANDPSKLGNAILEWLHLGETLPLIDDVAHVRARALTAVVKVSRESQDKSKDIGRGENNQGEKVDTWTKVPRQYMRPETLNEYNLPWMEDEHDSNCIIVKRLISQAFQEELFAHTHHIHKRPRKKQELSTEWNPDPTPNADIILQCDIINGRDVEDIADDLLAQYTNA